MSWLDWETFLETSRSEIGFDTLPTCTFHPGQPHISPAHQITKSYVSVIIQRISNLTTSPTNGSRFKRWGEFFPSCVDYFSPRSPERCFQQNMDLQTRSKPTLVYRSACHACPSWRRRSGLHNPNICHQHWRPTPPLHPPRTIYYFSSGELARKVILPEFEFYAKLCLFKTCIVIRSTSSGTKSRISDSHWLHNQVFAIKHTIHLNRIFLPFIGWLSPQLQHWYLIAATIV